MSWNHPGGPRGAWSMPYGYGAPYGGYGHWGGPPGPRPPPGFGPRPPYWGPGGVSFMLVKITDIFSWKNSRQITIQ